MIEIPIFKNDDVEIFYILEGSGQPLVLVHGTNTKWQAWQFQIDFFRNKMKVIAFDNRGSGKSSRPDYPYTMDMYVEDLKGLLDHLKIQDKIHLCGMSMGGNIAQEFTLKYPELVKTLILLGTSCHLSSAQFEQTMDVYKKNYANMSEEQIFQMVLKLIFTRNFQKELKKNPDLFELIRKDSNFIAYSNESPEIKDYVNQWEALRDFDLEDRLEEITQPTLIAGASEDLNTPPSESRLLHELIPNSELKIFNDFKHGFPIEIHQDVNNLIWSFLNNHMK